MELSVLYEDEWIIVVVKPCKVPVQPDKTGDMDMMTVIERYMLKNCEKSSEIGLVHRLDRPVGGVMIFAKTKAANAYLSKEIQNNQFTKQYLAVVCGVPKEACGEFKDYLLKNGKTNMSIITHKGMKNAKEAILRYKLIKMADYEYGKLSLVEIELLTGRHHQIRVQFAHRNIAIWGDKKYNIDLKNMPSIGETQIALWSKSLSIKHPKTGKTLFFSSNPEDYPFSLFE